MKKERVFLLLILGVVLFSCKPKTTIDEQKQKQSIELVSAALNTTASDSAVLIVMDAVTGEIRTGIKLLKDYSSAGFKPAPAGRLNYRTQPGGIVIPFTVMAALEECSIDLSYPVDAGKGRVVLHERTVYDQEVFDKGGYGMINLGKCVVLPSFVGTVKTLELVFNGDLKAFEKRMRAMSIGMPDDENPFDNTPNFEAKMNAFSVGFYFELSPLQLTAAWNGLANNGRMLRPAFTTADTGTINPAICKPATIKGMKKLLTDNAVSEFGATADMAFLKNINSIKNTYKRDITATFAGWFPAESPRYTCLLVMSRSESPDMDPEIGKKLLLTDGKKLFGDVVALFGKAAAE